MFEREKIAPLARAGAAKARLLGRPVLVTWASSERVAVDLVELWADLRADGERSFFWSSPWSGRQFVATGTVADLGARGEGRFADVRQAWHELSRDALASDAAAPFLVGGFAFRPAAEHSAARLPDALLWLPEAQVVADRPGSTVRLLVNAIAHPDTDPAVLAARMTTAARRVTAVREAPARSDPGPAGPLTLREVPCGRSWRRLVADAVAEIRQGSFEKVVLARRVDVRSEDDFDLPGALLQLVNASPAAAVFAAEFDGSCFLGATPEYLLHTRGSEARTVALAGSARRGATAAEDAMLEQRLLASGKDLREHAVVVSRLVGLLEQTCGEVWQQSRPGVLKLPYVQHLQTRLRAELGGSDLLQLVGALHPTPALGGHPSEQALPWLAEHEGLDRGWYAAPIGWVDTDGDGEFAVAIRSALVTGRTATVYAGCGVVADSVPAAEYAETQLKLQPMLAALRPYEVGAERRRVA